MLSSEYAAFEIELLQVAKLYSKTLEDDLVEMYWQSLKDLPFDLVKARLKSYVKRGKFFPKPAEIRPKDDDKEGPALSHDAKRSVHMAMIELAEKSPKENGHLKAALTQNAREWLRRFQVEPEAAKADYAIARHRSDLASIDDKSPLYAEMLETGPQPVDLARVTAMLNATIKRCGMGA